MTTLRTLTEWLEQLAVMEVVGFAAFGMILALTTGLVVERFRGSEGAAITAMLVFVWPVAVLLTIVILMGVAR